MKDDERTATGTGVGSTTEPFRMTDLEEALFRPGGAERAVELIKRLEQLQASVQETINSGLSPERFERAGAAVKALAAGRSLLVRILPVLQRG